MAAPPGLAPPVVAPPVVAPVVAVPPVVAPPVVAPPPVAVEPPSPRAVSVLDVLAGGQEAVEAKPVPVLADATEPTALETKPGFDWEELIGVRLFSWAAGILLALAAVYFLGYSIQQGWLKPPVQMAIGLAVGAGLIVGCELKAARRYPVTANALDGSAIAILFATFFAAYQRWELLDPAAAFGLMALVTVVAVLLSIRRDSVFIALLGLVGGFSTPALLSTGQDNPIGLFGYLLLLNAGLGWVAYRKRWPVLVGLSLLFTTLYQWGWVTTFLTPGKLPVATAIFLAFPILGFVSLGLAGRSGALDVAAAGERRMWFEEVASLNAALPLLFAVFMATSQAYGEHPALMFAFLFCVDAGLFAVALWRRQPMLHVLGGVATLVVFAAWMSLLYGGTARVDVADALASAYPANLGYVSLFVVLYLASGLTARRGPLRLEGVGRLASYAAPLLLFVFPTVMAAEPGAVSPALPFAVLFALLAACAAFAAFEGESIVYFLGAFMAVAAEAAWSGRHLTGDTLLHAVAIYGLFGLLFVGVPLAARRWAKPLRPEWLGGALLVASIALLFFLSNEAVAPESLWGLALLLGVLNVALLAEARAAGLRWLAVGGGALSWLVIGAWWTGDTLTSEIVPAVSVVAGFALLMLGGQFWAGGEDTADDATQVGMSLALAGHMFMLLVAARPTLSIPPWPMFATLAVLDLAVAAAALGTRRAELLAAALGLSQIDLVVWATVGGISPWPLTALVAGSAVAALGLGCAALAARRITEEALRDRFDMAAAVSVILGQTLLIVVAFSSETPAAIVLAAFHLLFLVALLALASVRRWYALAMAAVALTWVATWSWQATHAGADGWVDVLTLAMPIYLVFVAYPLVLGKRVGRELWPHLAAVLASASFFYVARLSIVAAGYEDFVGALPVVQAALLGVVLAGLLRIEPRGRPNAGPTRARRRRGARLRHRRHPAAVRQAVDHDRVGARGGRAGVALPADPASRPVLVGDRPAGGGLRTAGAEPRGARLPRAERGADPQLVPLHVSDVRRRHARRRLDVLDDPGHRRGTVARIAAGARCRHDPAVLAAEHRDRRLLRHRRHDPLQPVGSSRTEPDIHARVGGLRRRPSGGRHRAPLPRRTPRRDRAADGRRAQGLRLGRGEAARSLPRDVAGRPRRLPVAGGRGAAALRDGAQEGGETRMICRTATALRRVAARLPVAQPGPDGSPLCARATARRAGPPGRARSPACAEAARHDSPRDTPTRPRWWTS